MLNATTPRTSQFIGPVTASGGFRRQVMADNTRLGVAGGDKMNITQDIKSVTYPKSRADDLLKQINATHRPVIIT